ncbi:MAG: AMP-binding protein [Desulfobulbaceae bacterium]|nr:AMP-binding protein [Desulfobulbaceae bacterium]
MAGPLTINGLVESSVRRYAQRPALSMAFAKPLSYVALGETINILSAALAAKGVKRGERVAILAENSPNWGVAFLAVTAIGAIAVPILPDFTEGDVRHIVRDASVSWVFTTKRQIEKILDCGSDVIKAIFTTDDSELAHLGPVETFSSILAYGSRLPLAGLDALGPLPGDTAVIIYTSGTSGHSKGVMLSHVNICTNVGSAQQIIAISPGATFLSILPLSHAYEFTLGFVLPLAHGCRVVYSDKAPTPAVMEAICRQERPEVICAVPMIMDKIYKKRVLPVIDANFWLRQLQRFPWGRRVVRRKIGARLADFFGGKLKVMAIGGAALNIETEIFLREARFPYMVGYGMTETSPLLAAGPLADPSVAIGSVGPPVPGVELRIADPDPLTGIGQIMARGHNVMQGYYQNPELTAETIDTDGWLATGDLGLFDERGNLHIKGRSKCVIVLAHGENVYPEVVEEKINACMQVVESLVVERNGRLEALVYLDYDLVDLAKGNQDAQRQTIQRLLAEIKDTVNRKLPGYSRVHTVSERTEPFVKTPTYKIKRCLYQ